MVGRWLVDGGVATHDGLVTAALRMPPQPTGGHDRGLLYCGGATNRANLDVGSHRCHCYRVLTLIFLKKLSATTEKF